MAGPEYEKWELEFGNPEQQHDAGFPVPFISFMHDIEVNGGWVHARLPVAALYLGGGLKRVSCLYVW